MLTPIQESLDRLIAHEGFGRYFLNTSWMLGEKILRIVAELFVGIYVARYLGPEQFGVFSYAIAFVALFGAIAKLGLDGIVVRDLVNHPNKRDIYLGTAFWLKLTGALLTLITLAIAVQFTSNDATTTKPPDWNGIGPNADGGRPRVDPRPDQVPPPRWATGYRPPQRDGSD